MNMYNEKFCHGSIPLPLERGPLPEQPHTIELPFLFLYPQLLRRIQATQDDPAPPAHRTGLQFLTYNIIVHTLRNMRGH